MIDRGIIHALYSEFLENDIKLVCINGTLYIFNQKSITDPMISFKALEDDYVEALLTQYGIFREVDL